MMTSSNFSATLRPSLVQPGSWKEVPLQDVCTSSFLEDLKSLSVENKSTVICINPNFQAVSTTVSPSEALLYRPSSTVPRKILVLEDRGHLVNSEVVSVETNAAGVPICWNAKLPYILAPSYGICSRLTSPLQLDILADSVKLSECSALDGLGCLALLLASDRQELAKVAGQWQWIGTPTGSRKRVAEFGGMALESNPSLSLMITAGAGSATPSCSGSGTDTPTQLAYTGEW